jgi:hypothetical protein
MRVSPAQIERVAAAILVRLVASNTLEPTAPEADIRARFRALLTRNFEEEAELDREAAAESERLVRRGAPGVRREDVDLRRVEQEIARLVEALAGGQPLASVQEGISERERRRADPWAKLEHLDGLAKMPRLDKTSLTAELGRRLTDWQGLLKAEPVKARQIMRKLLAGRLVFEPLPLPPTVRSATLTLPGVSVGDAAYDITLELRF